MKWIQAIRLIEEVYILGESSKTLCYTKGRQRKLDKFLNETTALEIDRWQSRHSGSKNSKPLFVTRNGESLSVIWGCSLWRAFFLCMCVSFYFSFLHLFCASSTVQLRKLQCRCTSIASLNKIRNLIVYIVQSSFLKVFDKKKNGALL